ncbi:MAG TPA: hypothetical protein VK842_03280, partial [bacterium]|nr:hypothetical protein [bacterium]
KHHDFHWSGTPSVRRFEWRSHFSLLQVTLEWNFKGLVGLRLDGRKDEMDQGQTQLVPHFL